jgi:hypothetical protein
MTAGSIPGRPLHHGLHFMFHPFLFLAYLVLFSWLITRIPFLRKTGLPAKWLVLLFLARVFASCLYGYIHTLQPDYASRMDTWRFYYDSLGELKVLHQDPLRFFRDLFIDPYQGGMEKIFRTRYSYWNDLKNNVMIKMVTLFDIFSFSDYYINGIFYNFIVFFGPAALYRVFREKFPGKWPMVLAGCFLVPSMLFWGSGLHKEGLLLLALGLALFQVKRLADGKPRVRAVVLCLLSLFVLFILRNNVLFALAPPLLALFLLGGKRSHTRIAFLLVNAAFILLFFVTPFFFPKLNLPITMHLRQQEFIQLGGRTALPVEVLEPSFKGFLHNLPSALSISFLHPRPGEGGLNYIPFTVEMFLWFALLILSFVFPDRSARSHALLLFSVNFAVLLFLIIGYCVPNVGAVIRYRSPGMTFLFLYALLAIDLKKLRDFFQFRMH